MIKNFDVSQLNLNRKEMIPFC